MRRGKNNSPSKRSVLSQQAPKGTSILTGAKKQDKTPKCDQLLTFWKNNEGKFLRSIDNRVVFIERGVAKKWQDKTSNGDEAWSKSVFMPLNEIRMFIGYDVKGIGMNTCKSLINW